MTQLHGTLSMVMIARNERDNVRPCFESFWDHVDEVVLCDTGSRDSTIGEARRFAKDRGEPDKLIVGRFRWCDDWAAARNHAHSLATGDVHAYVDLDDRIVGGEHLREVADRLADPAVGVVTTITSGPTTPEQWRHRIFRAPVKWKGRAHEQPEFEGLAHVTKLVRWHHLRSVPRGRRDLEIALKWARAEPDNPRPLLAAAVEASGAVEDWAAVELACSRGMGLAGAELESVDADSRGLFCHLWGLARFELGDRAAAKRLARQAIGHLPGAVRVSCRGDSGRSGAGQIDLNGTLTGSWLLLARLAFDGGESQEALRCAAESATFATVSEQHDEAMAAVEAATSRLLLEGRGHVVGEVLRRYSRPGRT